LSYCILSDRAVGRITRFHHISLPVTNISAGPIRTRAQISLVVESQSPRPHPGPSESACSIRVSTRGFLRLWRIVRKRESVKFFVFNNRQWCESHPLRHPINHSHIIVCGVVSPVLRLSEKLDTCGTRAREGDLLRSQRTAEIGGREIAEAWKRAVGEKSFVEVPRGAARRM